MLYRLRLAVLAALALRFLTGCPVKGASWEPPAFPETASNTVGPARATP